MPTAFNVI